MVWVLVAISFTIAGIEFYNDRRIYSATGIFVGIWAILLFLSALHLYGIYETSDRAYGYVFLALISYWLGSRFTRKIKIKERGSSNIINEQVYNILIVICLVGLIYNIRVIATYFAKGFNVEEIYYTMARTTSGEETELTSLRSTWLERIQQYVGYPLLYTLVPVSIAAFFRQKKIKYLVVAVGLSLIRFLFDFRRTYLIIMAFYIVTLILIKLYDVKALRRVTQKLKRRTIVMGGLFLGVFIFISTIRRNESEEAYSFLKNFYIYYVGSLPYFSQRLAALNKYSMVYTLGLTSFRGLAAPFFAFFGLMGFNEPALMTQATAYINSLHSTIYYIADGLKFNSYATLFFEFYLDGGMIGLIGLSFAFGGFSYYLYKRCKLFNTVRDQCRYAYFLSVFILLSVLHFNGAVVCYIWPLILERMLFIKEK